MDAGYNYLVETFIPLNHDRYKTYFSQFIALHFGLIAAMATMTEESIRMRVYFCVIGLLLSFVGFLVQWKVWSDIEKTWEKIRNYEAQEDFPNKLKLANPKRPKLRASVVMLVVPFFFGSVYLGVIASAVC